MKIEVILQPELLEPEVTIRCKTQTAKIRKLVSILEQTNNTLLCSKEQTSYRLDSARIFYIEAVDRKTFVYTEREVYETKKCLYQLEEELKASAFFRVSKAFLVNLLRVKALRPEIGARLILTMENEEELVVSRRYAKEIKRVLEVL